MHKIRKIGNTSEERPRLTIPRPVPREKVRKSLGGNTERKVVEIDLVSHTQDRFTIDL